MEGCSFKELSVRLLGDYEYAHASVSVEEGTKGQFGIMIILSMIICHHIIFIEVLVCFDRETKKRCELFDGSETKPVNATKMVHAYGGLALYNGRAIAIAGLRSNGVVEILSENGWTNSLPVHPR